MMRLFILALLCTSCYRMPEEDEVSMVPNVNNPKYANKNNPTSVVMPSVEY